MTDVTAAHPVSDAVAYAAQMGRLDFITAVLAALAIMLAIGGIFAFFDLRGRAKAVARSVAAEESHNIAEAAAVSYLERELPTLISEYNELARHAAHDEVANAIAEAQEDAPNAAGTL